MESQTLSLLGVLQLILGYEGRVVSQSKSCGPPMAVYNSNLVVEHFGNPEQYSVVWYGDINLTKQTTELLTSVADAFQCTLYVFREHPIRTFIFNKRDQDKILYRQQRDIKNRIGLVWTSKEPEIFDNKSYNEMFKVMSDVRNTAIRQKMITHEEVTPRGTEWTWYNEWFYKSIYKAYILLHL